MSYTTYSPESNNSSPAPSLQQQKDRNKLNQRAFRLRRQQRVQELEQKLREYEAAQLKATQQMQQAARVVAAENAMLRDVLRSRLGIGEREIEALRQEWISGNQGQNLGYETTERFIPSFKTQRVEFKDGNANGSAMIREVQQQLNSTSDSTSEQQNLTVKTTTGKVSCCGPKPDSSSVRLTESSAFMSCEKAAEILSSIRSQDELHDVRARLGCTSPSTCMIENTTVMDVMNESI